LTNPSRAAACINLRHREISRAMLLEDKKNIAFTEHLARRKKRKKKPNPKKPFPPQSLN